MDRSITYNGEQINSSDICYSNLFSMIGLAKLAKGILGSGPFLNDLDCTPTAPPSMDVVLNPGEVYMTENVDDTGFGPLPPDTTHQILKQGILLDAENFTLTAPVTLGDSVNYLIQVTYQDNDNTPENRPYFGAPPETKDTIRSGLLVGSLKPGVSAPTGTQVTPVPDVGYVGAWVVTVANGQTSITSPDISQYPGAPFLAVKLPDTFSQTEGDARYARKAVTNTFSVYQEIPQLIAQVNFAVGSGQQQSVSAMSEDVIEFNHIVEDIPGWWDSLNFRFSPGLVGLFEIVSIIHRPIIVATPYIVSLYKNGNFVRRIGEQLASTAATTTFGSMIIRTANITDYFDLRCYNADASNSILLGLDIPVSLPFQGDTNLFQIRYLGP